MSGAATTFRRRADHERLSKTPGQTMPGDRVWGIMCRVHVCGGVHIE